MGLGAGRAPRSDGNPNQGDNGREASGWGSQRTPDDIPTQDVTVGGVLVKAFLPWDGESRNWRTMRRLPSGARCSLAEKLCVQIWLMR